MPLFGLNLVLGYIRIREFEARKWHVISFLYQSISYKASVHLFDLNLVGLHRIVGFARSEYVISGGMPLKKA